MARRSRRVSPLKNGVILQKSVKKISLSILGVGASVSLLIYGFASLKVPIQVMTLASSRLIFLQQESLGELFSLDFVDSIKLIMEDNSSTGKFSSTQNLELYDYTEQEDDGEDKVEEDSDKTVSLDFYEVKTTDAKPSEGDGKTVRNTIKASQSTLYAPLEHGFVKNLSSLSQSEITKLFEAPLPFEVEDSEKPQVLIYHTHATESFQTYYSDSFDKSVKTRSTDNNKNMVAVGEVLSQYLNTNGITTLHSSEQHDNPSYTEAYDNSHKTISEYLEKYPSIKVVLDLHRDAIQGDNVMTAPATEIDGVKLAQIMIISCCDDGSGRLPNYKENLKFATKLQNQLESDYPTITRPILLDDRYYNQDLSSGGLLIEVGGHANTLEEAKNSALCLGDSLVNLLSPQ